MFEGKCELQNGCVDVGLGLGCDESNGGGGGAKEERGELHIVEFVEGSS